MVKFWGDEVFNGLRETSIVLDRMFPMVGNHWPNEPLFRSNVVQYIFIRQQDIAYSNQPDYGQRQGLGAEKELKTSEKWPDGAGREGGDSQAPEQTFK